VCFDFEASPSRVPRFVDWAIVSSIAARRRREEHDPSTRPGNIAATRCKDAPNTRLLMNTLVL
jgi:hypothetical protein